jgi:hypothetical protein
MNVWIGSKWQLSHARPRVTVARPTKTLQEHLRDGSFRADRHAGLLLGPLVDDPDLAGLQATYRSAASTDEQRLVAIAFAQEGRWHEGRKPSPILNGRDGAAVAEFFASNFVHTKGPAAGRAFELEDWQRAFVDEFYKRDEEGRRIYRLAVSSSKTPSTRRWFSSAASAERIA